MVPEQLSISIKRESGSASRTETGGNSQTEPQAKNTSSYPDYQAGLAQPPSFSSAQMNMSSQQNPVRPPSSSVDTSSLSGGEDSGDLYGEGNSGDAERMGRKRSYR